MPGQNQGIKLHNMLSSSRKSKILARHNITFNENIDLTDQNKDFANNASQSENDDEFYGGKVSQSKPSFIRQDSIDQAVIIQEKRDQHSEREPFKQLQNNSDYGIEKKLGGSSHAAAQSMVIPKDRVTLSDHFKAVKIDSLKVTLDEAKLPNGPHL